MNFVQILYEFLTNLMCKIVQKWYYIHLPELYTLIHFLVVANMEAIDMLIIVKYSIKHIFNT